MSAETLGIGFPKGHTSFTLYSGSFELRDYQGAYFHSDKCSAKGLRITLYTTHAEAVERHGKEARRLTSNRSAAGGVNRLYKNIQAPTQKFFGFIRNVEYNFSKKIIPIYINGRTDTSVTFDVDLTGELVADLIKTSRKGKTMAKTTVKETSAITNDTNASKKRAVAMSVVQPTVRRAALLTLASSLTLGDLKRMGLKIKISDSADQVFDLEIR